MQTWPTERPQFRGWDHRLQALPNNVYGSGILHNVVIHLDVQQAQQHRLVRWSEFGSIRPKARYVRWRVLVCQPPAWLSELKTEAVPSRTVFFLNSIRQLKRSG